MKLIIFAEAEVADAAQAVSVIKKVSELLTVNDFQIQDEQLKNEIKDKAAKQ